jgi:hypothetical protein
MKASEFDQRFDDGEDIIEYLDLSQAKRPQLQQINLNLPIKGAGNNRARSN